MTNPVGPLVGADEWLCHQVADTFAVVGTSDLSWTEKICAMAAAKDGSLQLAFGLGKYANRNVMDGYAGLSRGVEQITVRASRRLSNAPEQMSIGPIGFEILEPLHKVRFTLEPSDTQPIAFDWTFEGVVPPFSEERTHRRNGYRVSSDLVRYHQVGTASGWVEIEGVRTELDPAGWVSTRDHSWGVRHDVGHPLVDLEPQNPLSGVTFKMAWCPLVMHRADRTQYGAFLHYQIFESPGFLHKQVMGGIEHPRGRMEGFADLVPSLHFDPANRRLTGGHVEALMKNGSKRRFDFEVETSTGFHLGAGLYFGLDGHHHGEWRGELLLEGERLADCSLPEVARRVHQLRDAIVHVRDSEGGEGWGNCQTMVTGEDEESGLRAEDSFI